MHHQSTVRRIHHVNLIAAQTAETLRFYRDILGLLPAGESPEDAPHRISLGDGTSVLLAITEASDAQEGEPGIGTVDHMALSVASLDGLLKWKRWLQQHDLIVYGPYDQQAYQDIVFTDPDGVLLEIATTGPGWAAVLNGSDVYSPPKESMAPYRDEDEISRQTWPQPVSQIEPDMALQGFHHIATIVSSLEESDRFYQDELGLQLVSKTLDSDDPEVEQWYWGLDGGRPGTLITAFPIVHEHEGGKAVYGRAGIGVIDHFALEVSASGAADGVPGTPPSEQDTTPHLAGEAQSISLRTPDGQVIDLVVAGEDQTLGDTDGGHAPAP